MQNTKMMRLNLGSLNPVSTSEKDHPNKRISSLRAALSQRRKGMASKAKLVEGDTIKPVSLNEPKMPLSMDDEETDG